MDIVGKWKATDNSSWVFDTDGTVSQNKDNTGRYTATQLAIQFKGYGPVYIWNISISTDEKTMILSQNNKDTGYLLQRN